MSETPEKPGYWAVLPASVRYDKQLPPSARLLYAEISSLTDERGYCFAGNEYFMALYNLSERTIRRLISELSRLGYVTVEDGDGGSGRRRIYAGVNPMKSNPDKNGRVSQTPGQKWPGNPDKNGRDNKLSINKKDEQFPPKAPQGAGADFVPKKEPDWKPERFAAFWAFYPLHRSKQACIRAWDKLRPSDELLAVIGKALKRQIEEEKARAIREKRDFEWKLHASTYLNNARWTDEPETTGPAPTRTERRDVVRI